DPLSYTKSTGLDSSSHFIRCRVSHTTNTHMLTKICPKSSKLSTASAQS
ncbi:unnamed protein product, partial [Musa acuminata subsp. burmannicoides]